MKRWNFTKHTVPRTVLPISCDFGSEPCAFSATIARLCFTSSRELSPLPLSFVYELSARIEYFAVYMWFAPPSSFVLLYFSSVYIASSYAEVTSERQPGYRWRDKERKLKYKRAMGRQNQSDNDNKQQRKR